MNLLERRRAMMGTKAEPEWDYVLTEKYSESAETLRPRLVQINAGQKITIAWENCKSFSFSRRLWALKNGATFSDTEDTNRTTKYLAKSGKETHIVATDGAIVLAGLNVSGTVAAYLFVGDCVKARIS